MLFPAIFLLLPLLGYGLHGTKESLTSQEVAELGIEKVSQKLGLKLDPTDILIVSSSSEFTRTLLDNSQKAAINTKLLLGGSIEGGISDNLWERTTYHGAYGSQQPLQHIFYLHKVDFFNQLVFTEQSQNPEFQTLINGSGGLFKLTTIERERFDQTQKAKGAAWPDSHSLVHFTLPHLDPTVFPDPSIRNLSCLDAAEREVNEYIHDSDAATIAREEFDGHWKDFSPDLDSTSQQVFHSVPEIEEEEALRLELKTVGIKKLFKDDDTTGTIFLVRSDLLHHFTSRCPYLSPVLIPPVPVTKTPFPSSINPLDETAPVSKRDTQRIGSYLENLRFHPLIETIISQISTQTLSSDLLRLTGECTSSGSGSNPHPSCSRIKPSLPEPESQWHTRNAITNGGYLAAEWIKQQFEKEGGFESCTFHHYRHGYVPNVICHYPKKATKISEDGFEKDDGIVVISAHYDSRGDFGSIRAPGGNDDGSGTAMLLSLTKVVKELGVRFGREVIIAAFSGEEQGLLGSHAFAEKLKEEDRDVALMLQTDMIGYRKPSEPRQLALPDKHDLLEARWLVGNISLLYAPELSVGLTPACCSDHQSFFNRGFSSTWVFERHGPIADPEYHSSKDVHLRDGYDVEQVKLAGSVVFATLLEVAGYDFE